MTPTLSALRERLYELDAKRTSDVSDESNLRFICAMPDAIRLIREQHRLLMEARNVAIYCREGGAHDWVRQAGIDFLRQLEESV